MRQAEFSLAGPLLVNSLAGLTRVRIQWRLPDQKSLDNKSRQLRKLKKFGSQLMPVTGVQRVSRRRSLAVILIQ